MPIAWPGSPFSKIARTTPLPPWADEILPVIIVGFLPVDFHSTVLPTSFVAFSRESASGISIKKCLGLYVFRPRRNWITLPFMLYG